MERSLIAELGARRTRLNAFSFVPRGKRDEDRGPALVATITLAARLERLRLRHWDARDLKQKEEYRERRIDGEPGTGSRRDEKESPPNHAFKEVIWMPRIAPETDFANSPGVRRIRAEAAHLRIGQGFASQPDHPHDHAHELQNIPDGIGIRRNLDERTLEKNHAHGLDSVECEESQAHACSVLLPELDVASILARVVGGDPQRQIDSQAQSPGTEKRR